MVAELKQASCSREAALNVARIFGDRVIEVRPHVSTDGVHPTGTGYRRIADMWFRP